MALVGLECGLLQLSRIRYPACVLVAAIDRDGHRAPSRTVTCMVQFVAVLQAVMVSSHRLLLEHTTLADRNQQMSAQHAWALPYRQLGLLQSCLKISSSPVYPGMPISLL
jgi:hypothetical protein